MQTIVVGAITVIALLAATWWAFFRETMTVIPLELTPAVETEEFRQWLGQSRCWVIWGRNHDNLYYAMSLGALEARRLRRKLRVYATKLTAPSP